MAEPKLNEWMERIVSLCKRRGLIYQSSELYGGLNGFWDYGPIGTELKRNVKDLWWRSMTRERDDVVGLDATIIMHPKIWKASGHVDTFSDPMVDCLACGKRFRADHVEAQSGTLHIFSGAVPQGRWNRLLNRTPKEQRQWLWQARDVLAVSDSGTSTERIDPATAQEKIPAQLKDALASLGSEMFRDLIDAWNEECAQQSSEEVRVLVPAGKRENMSTRAAEAFYKRRGLDEPIPTVDRAEAIENTTSYCNECGGPLTAPQMFNLMFKTTVGPVADEDNVAYLRPETAQAIFVQFKNVVDSSRVKVPFGIAQMGKAFRNEVTPRNFTFRSREFEQMELEFFIRPDELVEKQVGSVAKGTDLTAPGALAQPQPNWGWEAWHKYWVEQRMAWYESIGLPRSSLEEYWQTGKELAHYAKATVDILYKFPFGTQELEGIAARGDFDLTQHQKTSGKSLEYFDEETRTKYLPHVIEPSAGVDRLVLALICHAYSEDEAPDDKGKMEKRVVLRFHPRVAPIKVGVFPLLKNRPELVARAIQVRDLLRPHMTVFYDDSGAIGRRYRRQDEIGTPFGITIDFDTLGERPELEDTVTLRNRDTMEQERVRIDELLPRLLESIR
jgi:glycyl-tRNA synthetase